MNVRLFSKRPLCFALVFMCVGLLIGALCLETFLGRIILLTVMLITVVLLFVFKKTRRFGYLPLFLLVGFLWITGSCDIYNATTVESGNYVLTGKVTSEISVGDKICFTIDEINVDGENFKGTAYVYYYDSSIDFSSGDYVSIDGRLISDDYKPFDGMFASNTTSGKRYTIITNDCKLQKESEPGAIDSIQLKVKENFYEHTRQDTADIAVALLFGDKTFIDRNLYDDIKVSGLAHTLAVSGLHIGLLAVFIDFILKKCKAKSWLRLLIVGLTLLCYLIMCDFTASAVRAFIMIICLSFASVIGKKRDSLSALALAGIIILLYSPLSLFAVGFQLSMCAVAGILFLNKFFIRLFKKKNKFTETVATSLSANILTYPITASAFGSFPVLFLLSNLIVLPLMSVMFIGIIFLAVFTLIIPIPNVLVIADYLLLPFKAVVLACSSFGIANMSVSGLGAFCIGYYGTAFLTSDFIFLRRDVKIKIALSLWAISTFLFILFNYLAL